MEVEEYVRRRYKAVGNPSTTNRYGAIMDYPYNMLLTQWSK